MRISSFAAFTAVSLALAAGASFAQQQQPPAAGLTEGMDPAIARRMAIPPADPVTFNIPPASNEWLTWGYDQERSGWNRAETTLSPKTVGKLKQVWSTQLNVPVDKYVLSTMTAPVVVAGVATAQGAKDLLIIHGANDTVFAVDAGSGQQLWSKSFTNPNKSTAPIRDWLCPKTPNATPTIDKARGIVFFLTNDGMLRGLNLADGADRLTPVSLAAPFVRAWSLNLIDNVIYSPSGRACGEIIDKNSLEYTAAISGLRRAGSGPLLDASAVNAADVHDLAKPVVTHFFTSGARPAAPWGRGGVARAPGGVVLETSNGRYDPAAGDFSESVLKLSPRAARLMDSFTPSNWMDNLQHDLSGSSNPIVFNFAGKTLIAVSQKEGVLRILDANNLGGQNHMTPLWQSSKLGNDQKTGTDPGRGVWGSPATYENNGRRFVYLPMLGNPSKDAPTFPVTNGPIPNGSIMAFEVKDDGGKISAVPAWTSTDMIMPDPPVVANGVVYALSSAGQAMQNGAKPGDPRMPYDVSAVLRSTPVSNMTLTAYDAESGKQLWSSGKTMTDWVHFSEPVVALGKVFVVTHDAHVIAFGLKK